jgi:squalene cyclase
VPRTSSLDATCFRLAQLDDLPHESVRPIVERALGFLAARQRDDGSWAGDLEATLAAVLALLDG